MSIKVRSSLLSLVIIAVLLFSAVGPTIVYADGGTSTDTPPTETTTSECASDGTSSECPSEVTAAEATATPEEAVAETTTDTNGSTETSTCSSSDGAATDASTPDSKGCASTEEATATVEPAADGSEPGVEATAPPAAEEVTPATEEAVPSEDPTILNDVPENVTVEVVNADGQSEPLATQAAADAIATSDPMWCPVVNGTATPPGGAGCTQSFPSFNELLNFLSGPGNATYQGAGTIYVQQGAYNGGESSVDLNSSSYNLSNIHNSDLTITGGWNISTNTVDPASTSNLTIPILIGTSSNPWGGSLTINNINISNTSGTGLILYAQDDISLENITVTNSANGAGAELHAGQNPDPNNSHDVNISNSHFERNKTAGAIITAPSGNVTIRNSSFSNPANARRQMTGIDITSGGSVSLLDVLADENREAGATINAGGSVSIGGSGNPFSGSITTSFSGTKGMNGSNFTGYGLQVVTTSDIAISNVAANNNFLWGASLTGGNVTIANSMFNANTTASPGFIDDTGLLVTSSGTVNIDHIEAKDNRLTGATITANGTGNVSINDSVFTNNNGVTVDSAGNQTFHGFGLNVVTGSGSISLNRVDASNNTLFGAHLESQGFGGVFGDITISSNPPDPSNPIAPLVTISTFSNNTTSNNPTGPSPTPLGRGLEVITGGNVFLDHVLINNNETFGANIQAGGDIFLDTVTATNNGSNGVEAQGNCTTLFLISGTYTNNGQYGLSIINMALIQSGLPLPVVTPNGAGDIFQNPGTCVFPATPATPPATPGTPSAPAPVASQTGSNGLTNPVSYALGNSFSTDLGVRSSDGISGNLGKVTLNSFLANARLANGIRVSIFTGKYAYIYSSSGMQIVAFSSSDVIAMGRPYKAY
jgi:Right handed beta helix region